MNAVVIVHQNRLLRRFEEARAFDADSAVTLAEVRCRNSWIFRRMRARGVFVETPDGRYYMNDEAALAFVRLRRHRILAWLAVALLVVLLVWAFS